MRFVLLAFATATGVLTAQAQSIVNPPQVAVAPHRSLAAPQAAFPRKGGAGIPLLGYLPRGETAELYTIVGTASRASIGPAIAAPAKAARIRFSPGQQYALVETKDQSPLGVWLLKANAADVGTNETAIPGAMSHPNLVAFSARGEAAVLFSRADKRLQVIVNLPGQPEIVRELSPADRGELTRVAISDDGSLLVADSGDGILIYSLAGSPWQFVSTGYNAQAWSFVPHSHDLVISDLIRKEVVLLSSLNEAPAAARILTTSTSADYLAITKDGQHVLAASSADGSIVDIQLSSGTTSRLTTAGQINSALLLRDGHTFLLSSDPTVSLLDAAALPTDQVPEGAASALHTIQLSH